MTRQSKLLEACQRSLTGSLGFLGYFGEGPEYLSLALTDELLVAVNRVAVEVYDVESGERTRRLDAPQALALTALTPRGELAAFATQDGVLSVVDTRTGAELVGGLASPGAPVGMAVSPTLDHLATLHDDGTLILWNLADGSAIHSIATGVTQRRPDGGRTRLAFNHDGSLVATGNNPPDAGADGDPGPVRLWSVATGQRVGPEFDSDLPFDPGTETGGDRGADAAWGTIGLAFGPLGKTLTTVGR